MHTVVKKSGKSIFSTNVKVKVTGSLTLLGVTMQGKLIVILCHIYSLYWNLPHTLGFVALKTV